MEKNTEVIGRLIMLSETTAEGLKHVYDCTKNGRFESTIDLFTDIVSSFHEMEKVLTAMLLELNVPELEEKTGDVVECMKIMLLAYEGDKDVRPMEILQFSLLPCFNDWQEALHDHFGDKYASSLN